MLEIIDVKTGEIVMDDADQINYEYRLSKESAIDWIGHVIKCGKLLIDKKAEMSHGEWLPWVMQYCEFNHSQATNYMNIASNFHRGGNFDEINSIKGILRLLAEPSELRGTGVDEKPIQMKLFKSSWVRILAVLRNYPDYVDICEQIDEMLAKHKTKHMPLAFSAMGSG